MEPELYGELSRWARSVDPARDALKLDLLEKALARGIPILAICRGLQLLNVAFGGTLYQDIASELQASIEVVHDPGGGDPVMSHPVRFQGAVHLEGVSGAVRERASHPGVAAGSIAGRS